MVYRGIVRNGVVILQGEKPSEGTVVDVSPVPKATARAVVSPTHPAIGIWKDRTDLPADPVEASKLLRQRLMRRVDE